MQAEDEERNRDASARFGAELLPDEAKVLTHCNAGSLATAYFGTALGVIFTAHEQGKIEHVWVDETRPVNQGGRLTAWELRLAGVPSALIADNMAASVMKNGWVDAVIVGADRICANGDTANKIGTYGLAILASRARHPVLRRCADVDRRPHALERRRRSPSRSATRASSTGFTVAGTFEPDSPEATRAFDLLTEKGRYDAAAGRGSRDDDPPQGRRLQLRRVVQDDAAGHRGLQPGLRRHARRATSPPSSPRTASSTRSRTSRPRSRCRTHGRRLDPRARHEARGRATCVPRSRSSSLPTPTSSPNR